MTEPNGIRGEVRVAIGPVTIVMAPTMGNLARLSHALDHPMFAQLYQRLVGTEIVATRAAIRHLTVSGEAADGEALSAGAAATAALEALCLEDLSALQTGFEAFMAGLTRKDDGTAAKNA